MKESGDKPKSTTWYQNRKVVDVFCDECMVKHAKVKSEYTRNIKLSRKNFCSISCAISYRNKNDPETMDRIKSSAFKTGNIPTNKGGDHRTPYLYYLKMANSRKHECDIDCEYLHEIWIKQRGICPLTDLHLQLKTHKTTSKDLGMSCASLDRIDSNKGYIKGNVQFVSIGINLAKSDRSDWEVKEWLRVIKHGVSEYDYVKSEIVEKMEQLVPL